MYVVMCVCRPVLFVCLSKVSNKEQEQEQQEQQRCNHMHLIVVA